MQPRRWHSALVSIQLCGASAIWKLPQPTKTLRNEHPKHHCLGYSQAQFTQDAEHLATGVRKFWKTLSSMGVFTQVASNIKGFAHKFACKTAYASCVNGALLLCLTLPTSIFQWLIHFLWWHFLLSTLHFICLGWLGELDYPLQCSFVIDMMFIYSLTLEIRHQKLIAKFALLSTFSSETQFALEVEEKLRMAFSADGIGSGNPFMGCLRQCLWGRRQRGRLFASSDLSFGSFY